jgi:hypothetical protein
MAFLMRRWAFLFPGFSWRTITNLLCIFAKIMFFFDLCVDATLGTFVIVNHMTTTSPPCIGEKLPFSECTRRWPFLFSWMTITSPLCIREEQFFQNPCDAGHFYFVNDNHESPVHPWKPAFLRIHATLGILVFVNDNHESLVHQWKSAFSESMGRWAFWFWKRRSRAVSASVKIRCCLDAD